MESANNVPGGLYIHLKLTLSQKIGVHINAEDFAIDYGGRPVTIKISIPSSLLPLFMIPRRQWLFSNKMILS